MTSVPARSWSVLEVELPAASADELVGRLVDVALGAEVDEPEGLAGNCSVRIYLRSAAVVDEARALLRAGLLGLGLAPAAARIELRQLDDARWAERYQASLRPFPLGRGFVVVPDGGKHVEAGRRSIRLVPSRAFGTGEHPTTRMCAELLEARVRPGSRWLDLGCGSAILSIVAVGCSAGEVLGVDRDAEAIEVARGVLRANGLADPIRLACGSVEECRRGHWDGVVANISSPFFIEEAAALPGLLAPQGLLAATGYASDDLDDVAAALGAQGLLEVERRIDPPWGLLVLSRNR